MTTAPEHPTVRIRRARTQDVPAIVELIRASGREETEEGAAAPIGDPQRIALVAQAGSTVVGWAKTHLWDHAVGPAPAGHYLGGVVVDPAWQRRGLGAALTAQRMDWIAERAPEAFYVVNATNTASIALHRRWGFREIARGATLQTLTFDGGLGLLMRASLPAGTPTPP